jgi:hypothetical protein
MQTINILLFPGLPLFRLGQSMSSGLSFNIQQCSGFVIWIQIQIQIHGSVHWITDPDPDPALFISGFQYAKTNNLFLFFFCLLLTVGTFTSFFKEVTKL